MATNAFNFGPVLDRVDVNVQQVLKNQVQIMATLDDLNAAVMAIQTADTNVQAAVATAISLIQSLHTDLGTGGSVSDAEVEAAVASLQTAAGDFSTAVTNLGGAKPQSP